MSSPTISVLMPVYNAERYVAIAVESILNQTFFDFEFLIINDGSTDKSLQILQEYANRDERIRLISRANRGLVATLNEMIALAKGEYIARMDADDIALPNRFDIQIHSLKMNPRLVLVGTWIQMINELGQYLYSYEPPTDHPTIDIELLNGSTSISHPSAMMRYDAVLKAKGYNPKFEDAEDLDLWLRLAEIGEIANLPQHLLQYRIHATAVSSTRIENQKCMVKLVTKTAWARRGIPGYSSTNTVAVEWWRAGNDKESQYIFSLKNGWAAWKRKHMQTWWTYAKKAIILKPFTLDSWKLLFFGFVKSPPE